MFDDLLMQIPII